MLEVPHVIKALVMIKYFSSENRCYSYNTVKLQLNVVQKLFCCLLLCPNIHVSVILQMK